MCSSAGPGQIYISNVVRDLGVEKGFRFDDGKIELLKGFSEPATTYELLGIT